MIVFLLAKEFHWLPSQIQHESSKDMKAMMHILSTYNTVRNAEIERAAKGKNTGGGRSGGKSKSSRGTGNRYIRREMVGPGGTRIEDVPI